MRAVDIEPFWELIEDNIRYFEKRINGIGIRIYSSFKKTLLNLPVIKDGD